MTRYGMAIDLRRCIGCQACAAACKIANNLPKELTYNVVYTKTDDDFDTIGTAVSRGALANDNAGGTFPNCILEFMPDGKTIYVRTFSPLFALSKRTAKYAWRVADYDQFEIKID